MTKIEFADIQDFSSPSRREIARAREQIWAWLHLQHSVHASQPSPMAMLSFLADILDVIDDIDRELRQRGHISPNR